MLLYLKRLPIATKLWLLIVIFVLVGLADNLTEMALINNRLHTEKETQLKHLVEVVHTTLQGYERAVRDGRLSEAAARTAAAETVRQMHYGALEYFWIHDLTRPVPVMVMHPTVPALNGQPLSEPRFDKATSMRAGQSGAYQPLAGQNLFVAMNQAIAATGDGFVTYDWPKPRAEGGVSKELYPKLSYVKKFEPWGWVVGSGIYIDDLAAEYWQDMKLRLLKAGFWVLLLAGLVWFITRTVVQPLRVFQSTIDGLRADANSTLPLINEQPGELGHLTRSFQALMEDLQRSRYELTSSIEKLRSAARAFSNMDEGIVIVDAGARILSVNPAFSRITDFPPEALIGLTLDHFFSVGGEVSGDQDDAIWSALKQAGRWAGEVRMHAHSAHEGGSVGVDRLWLSILASRDQQEGARYYVGFVSRPAAISKGQ